MTAIKQPQSDQQLADYRKQLKSTSTLIHANGVQKPAPVLSEVAAWCQQHNIDFEAYGSGDFMQQFEQKIAALLGFPAARFMPSGVLAQLSAVRIWSDQSGCPHFAMHPTSHLELHEELGYSTLYGLNATLVGPKKSPLLAQHLDALSEPISTLLVELPIREAGGQLPSWDELEALKVYAKNKRIRLHLDGARLWECQSFYQREYREICAGFDSVYVSFYKGIGALPGAMLLGPEDFIEEAKLWQRRAGGTVQTLVANVASAAMKFDQSLLKFPAYYRKTLELATAIEGIAGLTLLPKTPQVNMLHIYLPFSPEIAEAARDLVAEEQSLWLFNKANAADTAESCYFELYVGDALMPVSETLLTGAFTRLVEAGEQLTKP